MSEFWITTPHGDGCACEECLQLRCAHTRKQRREWEESKPVWMRAAEMADNGDPQDRGYSRVVRDGK